MKYIKTFEQFINESLDNETLNEAAKFSDIHKVAKDFLSATKSKFKVSDSQIHKTKSTKWTGMKKGKETRYNIKIVVPENKVESAREFADKFKEENKEVINDNRISFSISMEVKGRKTLWPSNNKEFFDI